MIVDFVEDVFVSLSESMIDIDGLLSSEVELVSVSSVVYESGGGGGDETRR